MKYDNCIKYIYDEMDEISKKEDLKNCNCVIWGIDSLAKCIVAYLRDIGNSNIRILISFIIIHFLIYLTYIEKPFFHKFHPD